MNGAFFIDKEAGCTSRDVVNEIIKKTEIRKVGHTGTLDPMATGVLVVCVGKATKLVELLSSSVKEYEAEITLGIETDTLDITGNIVKEEVPKVTSSMINDILSKFTGTYEQEVPLYSAVKVNGKKLYQYARENIPVTLPKKMVTVYALTLVGEPILGDRVVFKIRAKVSKGTYIRSLVRDIAYALNTVGTMSSLRRISLGNVSINDCKSIDDITIKDMTPIDYLVKNFPHIAVEGLLKKAILNGKIIENIYDSERIVLTDETGKLLAIYKKYDKDVTKMKPEVMIGGSI